MAHLPVPKLTGGSSFPAKGSPQIVGGKKSLSAPGGRVTLKPGHSLMDWIRLGKGGKDLTGVGGQKHDVTPEELAKHNKEDDLWMAVRGKVYNLTHYTDFHPGGIPELMRAAGKDGTQLFDEIHKWVNYESMLNKCLIGKYLSDASSISSKGKKSLTGSSTSLLSNGLTMPPPKLAPPAVKQQPRHDWYQSDDYVTIVVFTKCSHIDTDFVLITKEDRNFDLKIIIDDYAYRINIELDGDIEDEYNVKVANSKGKLEIELKKSRPGMRWLFLGKDRTKGDNYLKKSQVSTRFHTCRVKDIQQVTHDSYLYCLELPKGSRMVIPLGYHVQVKVNVEGMDICKSYTVVPSSLMEAELDPLIAKGQVIYLMIKIYEKGEITPHIGRLQINDKLLVSDFDGDFQASRLSDCDHLVLYAAGTGITPMLGLIQQALFGLYTKPNRKIRLLFFNKRVCDILWHKQLEFLVEKYPQFSVTYILSIPEKDWSGSHGRISEALVKESIPTFYDNTLFCGCGPTEFTKESQRLISNLGFTEQQFHAFIG